MIGFSEWDDDFEVEVAILMSDGSVIVLTKVTNLTVDREVSPIHGGVSAIVKLVAHQIVKIDKASIADLARVPARREERKKRKRHIETVMGKRMIDVEDTADERRAKEAEEKRLRTRALQERRAAKAQEALRRWRKREKMARGKVRKLKIRVKYYATKLAKEA